MEQAMMDNVMTRKQAVSMVLDLYGRIDELNGALDDMSGRLSDATRATADGTKPDDGGLSERAAEVLPALLWEKVARYGQTVRVTACDDGSLSVERFDAWLTRRIDRDYLPDVISVNDAVEIMRDYALPIYDKQRTEAIADARAERDGKDGDEDE